MYKLPNYIREESEKLNLQFFEDTEDGKNQVNHNKGYQEELKIYNVTSMITWSLDYTSLVFLTALGKHKGFDDLIPLCTNYLDGEPLNFIQETENLLSEFHFKAISILTREDWEVFFDFLEFGLTKYKELASSVVNLEYHKLKLKVNLHEVTYTQLEWLEYLLENVKLYKNTKGLQTYCNVINVWFKVAYLFWW